MAPPPLITCVGGVAVNRKFILHSTADAATSNPADCRYSHGGVVRNIAENLARLNLNVSLISLVGDDASGRELLDTLERLGIDTAQVSVSEDKVTAEYVAVFNPDGELVLGVASMEIFEQLTAAQITQYRTSIISSDWVILDCNLPAEAICKVLQFKQSENFLLAVDTVSVSKAKRLPRDLSGIDLLFTNRDEAESILSHATNPSKLDASQLACQLRNRGAAGVIVSDGPHGHVANIGMHEIHTPALTDRVADVSGAGDSLIAGIIYALHEGGSPMEASHTGTALASLTVESDSDVRPDLSRDLVSERVAQNKKHLS